MPCRLSLFYSGLIYPVFPSGPGIWMGDEWRDEDGRWDGVDGWMGEPPSFPNGSMTPVRLAGFCRIHHHHTSSMPYRRTYIVDTSTHDYHVHGRSLSIKGPCFGRPPVSLLMLDGWMGAAATPVAHVSHSRWLPSSPDFFSVVDSLTVRVHSRLEAAAYRHIGSAC